MKQIYYRLLSGPTYNNNDRNQSKYQSKLKHNFIT